MVFTKKVFLTIVFIVTIIMAASVLVHADNVCYQVGGSAADYDVWTVIEVDAAKNGIFSNKIKFTQTKGAMGYSGSLYSGGKVYGGYTIKIIEHKDGKDVTTTKEWRYSIETTIKLKDNTKYTIKIKPYAPSKVGDAKCKFSAASILPVIFKQYNKNNWYWDTVPEWTVSSTKAISTCVQE